MVNNLLSQRSLPRASIRSFTLTIFAHAKFVTVVLVASALLVSTTADARKRRKRRPAFTGKVSHVTAKRAYLELGALDGIEVGQKISLRSKRRAISKCEVDLVSDHSAGCMLPRSLDADDVVAGFRTLSPLTVPKKKARKIEVRPRAVTPGKLPARPSFPRVSFDAPIRQRRRGFRANTEVGMQVRAAISGLEGARAALRGRMFVNVYGAQLYFPGLQLFARAQLDGAFPTANSRFRALEPVRLEVHELALAYRNSAHIFTGAVGRFRPWRAPGVSVLDGLQAGIKLFDGAFEVGTFGGVVPTQLELAPQINDGMLGVYWSAKKSFAAFSVSNSGSVVARSTLKGDLRAALSGETHARITVGNTIEATSGLRLSFTPTPSTTGPAAAPLASVDLGYFQASTRPFDGLRLFGAYRFQTPNISDDAIAALPSILSGLHHVSAGARWSSLEWLEFGLQVLGSAFIVDEAFRMTIAPEVGLPKLIGNRFAIYLGAAEHLGFLGGNQVYLRTRAAPWSGAFTTSRVYYVDAPASPDTYRSMGANISLEQLLFDRFRMYGRVSGELALPSFFGHASVSSGIVHAQGELGASATF